MARIFTPVCKLLKSALEDDTVKMLRAQSKGKNAAVKETPRFFFLAAGNNKAENRVGCIKNSMRKLGNMGRFNSTAKAKKNIQAMHAAALSREGGFDRVMRALKQYRLACSRGDVQISPKNAFEAQHCHWLLPEEDSSKE